MSQKNTDSVHNYPYNIKIKKYGAVFTQKQTDKNADGHITISL